MEQADTLFRYKLSTIILSTVVLGWYDRIYGPSYHSLFQATEAESLENDWKIMDRNLTSDVQIYADNNTFNAKRSLFIKKNKKDRSCDNLKREVDLNQKYWRSRYLKYFHWFLY